MLDNTHTVMTQLAQAALTDFPNNWVRATVTAKIVAGYSELQSKYVPGGGGEEEYVEPGDELCDLFQKLRVAMYETAPSQGAWYIATLSLTSKGQFAYKFDYDDTTQFQYTPDARRFAEDRKRFPRVD